MTHPNTKKLYEVLDECFLVFHPRTKRRVFELFFWMRCHAGRIPIVNRGKKHGATSPPPAKNVSKTTTTNRLYGFKKKSGRFFFSNGLLWVNRKLFPARRDKWFFCWDTTFLSVRKIVVTKTSTEVHYIGWQGCWANAHVFLSGYV